MQISSEVMNFALGIRVVVISVAKGREGFPIGYLVNSSRRMLDLILTLVKKQCTILGKARHSCWIL